MVFDERPALCFVHKAEGTSPFGTSLLGKFPGDSDRECHPWKGYRSSGPRMRRRPFGQEHFPTAPGLSAVIAKLCHLLHNGDYDLLHVPRI